MADSTRVDEWLDQWERFREEGHPISLEEFIRQHCQSAPNTLVDQFRSKVKALQSIDARVEQAGAPQPRTRRDIPKGTGEHKEPRFGIKEGGEPVPGYRLVSSLGHGGFGQVWRATAPGGLPVALKFVPLAPGLAQTEQRALELLKEVRHPHLLVTVGAWEQEAVLIIAMELADSTLLDRLHEAVRQGHPGIPVAELLKYMAEAAEGLDYLHEARRSSGEVAVAGYQHRDVKPQNLLIVGGGCKVGDFGLARFMDREETGHSGCMTVPYAAPEFFTGRTSAQSDQYSLAVTYCELRGGRLPFTGNQAQIMNGHLREMPDLSMLPEKERPVVARALAKDPQGRWASCRTFVEALCQVQLPQEPVLSEADKLLRSLVGLKESCLAGDDLDEELPVFKAFEEGINRIKRVVAQAGRQFANAEELIQMLDSMDRPRESGTREGTTSRLPVPAQDIEVTVPGEWYSRPSDNADVEWTLTQKTPGMVRWRAGEIYLLAVSPQASDQDLTGVDRLKVLANLEQLELISCERVTDVGMACLKNLTGLRGLFLNECKHLTDEGLAYLKNLSNLQQLGLGKCRQVTDASLAFLKDLIKLQELELENCQRVTDTGLTHLKSLTSLQRLDLRACDGITDEGVAELQRALPGCSIER